MGGVYIGKHHVGRGVKMDWIKKAGKCVWGQVKSKGGDLLKQGAKEVGKQVLQKGGEFLKKKLGGKLALTETEKVEEEKKKKNAAKAKGKGKRRPVAAKKRKSNPVWL
jgi:hypothetical protein